jgi:membrane protease YdiL (CAAX protease family)
MFRKIASRIGFRTPIIALLSPYQSKPVAPRINMEKKKIVLFTVLTFAISWIAWWILVFIKQDNSQIFRISFYFLIFFVGGIAPTIAPFLAIRSSDKKFKEFILSILKFRVNIFYYIFGLFLIFGVSYLGIWIYELFKGPIRSDLSPDFISLIRLTLMMIVFGGLEELGWRGLLLPALSKIFKFHIAALFVGVIWAIWHLPLFFMPGTAQYQSDFIAFAIQVIGLGFVLAWLFGRTKSIFICVLFHALANAVSSSGLSSPGGNQYVIALIWLFVGLGLVILDRKNLILNNGQHGTSSVMDQVP